MALYEYHRFILTQSWHKNSSWSPGWLHSRYDQSYGTTSAWRLEESLCFIGYPFSLTPAVLLIKYFNSPYKTCLARKPLHHLLAPLQKNFQNIQIRRELKPTIILRRRHEWFPPGAVLALKTLIKDEECESKTQTAAQHFPITAETLPTYTLRRALPDTALLLIHKLTGTFLGVRELQGAETAWLNQGLSSGPHAPAVGKLPRATAARLLEPSWHQHRQPVKHGRALRCTAPLLSIANSVPLLSKAISDKHFYKDALQR